MKHITTISDLKSTRAALLSPIGLVPTMGYLHAGHLSLVKRARVECANVVVSIFVNPTQFGPQEDLQAYPRDVTRDLDLLAEEGTDLVWIPRQEDMYPAGYQTWVTVEEVTQRLEGAFRPGHFRGVATVVAKLINCVQPDKTYFGQKDAQQVIVIRRMVRDLNIPGEIIVCPTVREADGLAMSSRNSYLNVDERRAAAIIFRALTEAQSAFQLGEKDAESLRKIMIKIIKSEPLARMQYVSCADPDTLVELHGQVQKALLSTAVYFGRTRLIDNLLLG
jgi:pantoate--beta-alanine ligase